MFQVGSKEFGVAQAFLTVFHSHDPDTLCWGVFVKGKRGKGAFADWLPAVISEDLLQTKPGELTHWKDLAGREVRWKRHAPDPQALVEVFETHGLSQARFAFELVRGRLVLDIEAEADLCYQPGFERRVPIALRAPLVLEPMGCRFDSKATCLALYRRFGLADPVRFERKGRVSFLNIGEVRADGRRVFGHHRS